MNRKKALEGIRVLDFTWFGAGPIGTKMLSANGAEVIRVESQNRLDGLRSGEPKQGDPKSPNTSLYFNNFNSDKYGILLNMNDAEGLLLSKKLVALSDVVITNFSPRAIDKWGLDYASLRKINPEIIVIHMPAMGMTGPKRHYAGFGPGIKAIAGLNMLMGFEGTPPVGPQGSYPDYCLNPSHCMTACLAALHYRHRTGRGQFIDFSQYESVLNAVGTALLEYTVNGRLLPRIGNRNLQMAPHGVYPCQGEDRWIAIAVEDDNSWEAFCRVIGRKDLMEDSRFASAPRRVEHADVLDQIVGQWTETKPAEEVMMELQRVGVAAGIAEDVQDLFEHDSQLRTREHYIWLNHPETGSGPVDDFAFRFNKLSSRPERAAPCLGEHNDYVFQELLGLSIDEANQLIIENVLY